MYFEMDDLRQSYVVAKNEIVKFRRSRRFTIYVALILIVFGLITALSIRGDGLGDTPGMVIENYVSFIFLLIILAVTLFASTAIVSEFEERTALILFTRPIKKTSIFIGKVVGCIVLETVMIMVYYLLVAIVSLIVTGSVPMNLLVSFGVAFLFMVAASGVATLIGSIMKKGSISALLTFFILFLMPFVTLTAGAGSDPWFMLDRAWEAICTCIPEYVELSNIGLQEAIDHYGLDQSMFEQYMTFAPDMFKTVVTMVAWSAVSFVLAWIAFIRREF